MLRHEFKVPKLLVSYKTFHFLFFPIAQKNYSMVEAIISAALIKIVRAANDEVVLLLGVKKQLDKMTNLLSAVGSLLQDADTRQTRDEPVRRWLLKLKDAAYGMDDLIEEWTLKPHQISSMASDEGRLGIFFADKFGIG